MSHIVKNKRLVLLLIVAISALSTILLLLLLDRIEAASSCTCGGCSATDCSIGSGDCVSGGADCWSAGPPPGCGGLECDNGACDAKFCPEKDNYPCGGKALCSTSYGCNNNGCSGACTGDYCKNASLSDMPCYDATPDPPSPNGNYQYCVCEAQSGTPAESDCEPGGAPDKCEYHCRNATGEQYTKPCGGEKTCGNTAGECGTGSACGSTTGDCVWCPRTGTKPNSCGEGECSDANERCCNHGDGTDSTDGSGSCSTFCLNGGTPNPCNGTVNCHGRAGYACCSNNGCACCGDCNAPATQCVWENLPCWEYHWYGWTPIRGCCDADELYHCGLKIVAGCPSND